MTKTGKLKSIQDKVSKLTIRLKNNTTKIDKQVAFQINSFLNCSLAQIEEIRIDRNCTQDEKEAIKTLIEKAIISLERTPTEEQIKGAYRKTNGIDKNDRKKELEEAKYYVKSLNEQIRSSHLKPDECETSLKTVIGYFQQIDRLPTNSTKNDTDQVKQAISALVMDLFIGITIEESSDTDTTATKSRVSSDSVAGTNILDSTNNVQQVLSTTYGSGSKPSKKKEENKQKVQCPQIKNHNSLPEKNKISSKSENKRQKKSNKTTSEKVHVPENETKEKSEPETEKANITEKNNTYDLSETRKKNIFSMQSRVEKCKSKVEKLKYPLSSEEYHSIRAEVTALQKNLVNAKESDTKQKVVLEIKIILQILDNKFVEHTNRSSGLSKEAETDRVSTKKTEKSDESQTIGLGSNINSNAENVSNKKVTLHRKANGEKTVNVVLEENLEGVTKENSQNLTTEAQQTVKNRHKKTPKQISSTQFLTGTETADFSRCMSKNVEEFQDEVTSGNDTNETVESVANAISVALEENLEGVVEENSQNLNTEAQQTVIIRHKETVKQRNSTEFLTETETADGFSKNTSKNIKEGEDEASSANDTNETVESTGNAIDVVLEEKLGVVKENLNTEAQQTVIIRHKETVKQINSTKFLPETETASFRKNTSKNIKEGEDIASSANDTSKTVENTASAIDIGLEENLEVVVKENLQNVNAEVTIRPKETVKQINSPEFLTQTETADFSNNTSKNIKVDENEVSSATDTNETVENAADAVNILDMQPHFRHSQFNNVQIPKDSIEFIEEIRNRAELFEEKVKKHKNPKDSIEYFIIDENLMRFVEELDKIKFQNNKSLLSRKIETLNYIKKLQKQLDINTAESNVSEEEKDTTNRASEEPL